MTEEQRAWTERSRNDADVSSTWIHCAPSDTEWRFLDEVAADVAVNAAAEVIDSLNERRQRTPDRDHPRRDHRR
jgi:hypothetical protein